MPIQQERADRLRALHRPGDPVIFVNAWDAVSARIVEELGFPAIATTSAGIAYVEGYPDGEQISREQMLAGVARVVNAVDVPVTADLEAAYGETPEDAKATARGAIDCGAVGLNFEDSINRGSALIDPRAQVARIEAMREVTQERNVPLVINARTDTFFMHSVPSEEWRLEEAIRRGNLYLEAGADCVFVPGVSDEATIARLADGIEGPLNVLAGATTPSVKRLAELGVARISVGSSAMAYVLAQFRRAAQTIKEDGTFTLLGERISHADLNALFEVRSSV